MKSSFKNCFVMKLFYLWLCVDPWRYRTVLMEEGLCLQGRQTLDTCKNAILNANHNTSHSWLWIYVCSCYCAMWFSMKVEYPTDYWELMVLNKIEDFWSFNVLSVCHLLQLRSGGLSEVDSEIKFVNIFL